MSPRGTRARRARKAPRTIWLVAGAVVIGATGVSAVAVTGGSEGAGPDDNSRPAKAHTLALDGKDQKKRVLPRTETQAFSLVGVSWDDSTDAFEGTAQIRTRGADDGTWTDWSDLDFGIRAPESAEGKDSGVRGASEPLWVGPSDAIEARVVADGEETAVPKALRLDMVDPGETAKEHGKGNGKGGTEGGGKGKPSAKPEKTHTADPSPSASSGETAPSTAPEPTGSTAEPTETPVTEQPASPTAPATSEAPQEPSEPTAEPSAPAPSDEPTVEPTAPTDQPDPAEPTPPATVDPQEPTAEPSATAPSEDPSAEPSSDPGSTPTSQPTASPSEQPGPAAPSVISRAGWGADESLVADPPSYLDKVDAVFVHHTAGTNSYDCAESPAIVRGILTYHVKTNGWNDIGYNFFVDKCGTVFEGRAGGVDKPVRGAHTYGFNGYSSGISVLGDYENGGTPSAAAKQAVADVAAWKLGLHGVDPQAKVTLTAADDTGVWKAGDRATLNTISGHRDGFATLCPGATLYSALPEIRSTAGASVYAAG